MKGNLKNKELKNFVGLTLVNADGDDVWQRHEIFGSDGLDADGERDGISGSERERDGLVDPSAQLTERHVILHLSTSVDEQQGGDGQFHHPRETLLEGTCDAQKQKGSTVPVKSLDWTGLDWTGLDGEM